MPTYTVTIRHKIPSNVYSQWCRRRPAFGVFYKGSHFNDTPEGAIRSALNFVGQSSNANAFECAAKVAVKRRVLVGDTCGLTDQDKLDRAYLNETRDCTVRATANALGIPYKDVHAAFNLGGRRNREGTRCWSVVPKAAELLGYKATRFSVRLCAGSFDAARVTLRTFLKQPPAGSFLLNTDNHSLCIRDGKVIDENKTSDLRRVEEYWTFEKI